MKKIMTYLAAIFFLIIISLPLFLSAQENQAPTMGDKTVSINENLNGDKNVVKLDASDNEGNSFDFSILSGDNNNDFKIIGSNNNAILRTSDDTSH